MEDKQTNKEVKCNKKSSEKKQFDSAVQFLLNCFDCIHQLEMTKVICSVMEDVRTYFFEMNSSSRMEAFSKVPYITIDELGFLKKKESARFAITIVTKDELLLLFVVYHLSKNGKSHFEEVIRDLRVRAPQVVSMILSCASTPAKLSYLRKYPQYFKLVDDSYLELSCSLPLPSEKVFDNADSFSSQTNEFHQLESNGATFRSSGDFCEFGTEENRCIEIASVEKIKLPSSEINEVICGFDCTNIKEDCSAIRQSVISEKSSRTDGGSIMELKDSNNIISGNECKQIYRSLDTELSSSFEFIGPSKIFPEDINFDKSCLLPTLGIQSSYLSDISSQFNRVAPSSNNGSAVPKTSEKSISRALLKNEENKIIKSDIYIESDCSATQSYNTGNDENELFISKPRETESTLLLDFGVPHGLFTKITFNSDCTSKDITHEIDTETLTRSSKSQDIWCKDDLMYKKLCASVLFLLNAFDSLPCKHLKKCISFTLPEVGIFLNELSKERQREVFSSIHSTLLVDGFLKLTSSYNLDTKYISKTKMRTLFIISYLALNGKTFFVKVVEDLYNVAPELTIAAFIDAKDFRWYSVLKNSSKYFQMNSRSYLTLTPSFYETNTKQQDQLSGDTLQNESNPLICFKQPNMHTESTNLNSGLGNRGVASMFSEEAFQDISSHSNFNEQNEETFKLKITESNNAMEASYSKRVSKSKYQNFYVGVEVYENCDILPVESPVLGEDILVETVSNIQDIVYQNTIETTLINVLEYPQKDLNSLSSRMFAAITYLLKFFKLNVHSGFLEILLHLVKKGSVFFKLPPSQQEEVIKRCFRKLLIDVQGNITPTSANDKQPYNLSKKRRLRLCICCIISEKGPMHYREAFKNYEIYVGCDEIPKDVQQLKFFQKVSNTFHVSDSGYVSLIDARTIELDYKSIICPNIMYKATTFETYVEENKPIDFDNVTVVQANMDSYCTEKHKKSSETDCCNKSCALKLPSAINDIEEAVNYDFLRKVNSTIHHVPSVDPVTIKNVYNETTNALSEPKDIWYKDELMYKKFCSSVLFLLHAFGPLNCEHLKKCISYMFPECGIFLNVLSKEKQRQVFFSIPSTFLDDDFLKLTTAYKIDTKFISKGKMRELFIVSYLALNGKANFMKVLEELYRMVPEVTIAAFSDAKDSRWYSFLKNASKYFTIVSRSYLTLTLSFYETDGKDHIQLSEIPSQNENNALAFFDKHGIHTESETSNNYDLMSCNFESRVPNQTLQNNSPNSNFDKENKETFQCQLTKSSNEMEDLFSTKVTQSKIQKIPNEESEGVKVSGNGKSSAEKCPVLENDVPIETATSVAHQNSVDIVLDAENTVTVLEQPQDVLDLLSERMIDGIAYILKFFEFNIYTGFLEKVLHLIKRGHHFFRLPPSQQEEVIKNCFSAFCIDEQGNVTSTFSSKKLTFILSKAKSMAMCMSYIISKKGSMHYAEVFKYYHKCVRGTNFQQDVKQLEYFRNRQYIYQVCDNGYVSLLKVRAIEWDYVSTLMTRKSCDLKTLETYVETNESNITDNVTVDSASIEKGQKSSKADIHRKFISSATQISSTINDNEKVISDFYSNVCDDQVPLSSPLLYEYSHITNITASSNIGEERKVCIGIVPEIESISKEAVGSSLTDEKHGSCFLNSQFSASKSDAFNISVSNTKQVSPNEHENEAFIPKSTKKEIFPVSTKKSPSTVQNPNNSINDAKLHTLETARICVPLNPTSVEPQTTNISLEQQGLCSKDGLIFKKFCASVTFLLHSFGKLHCSQLTEYISYVLGDVGIFMDALSQEKRQELFSNIPSTERKENSMRLITLYELDTTYLSKNKLRLLYTVSYLDLHGKTHIVKLMDRLHRSAPQLTNLMTNMFIYFKNSKYFELDSGNYLTLPSFFYFTACANLFQIPHENSLITSHKNFDIQKQFKESGNIHFSNVLKSNVSNTSNGIPQICDGEKAKQEICMIDRICTIVREGIVFLFEHFKCPFDFQIACVVLHALHEAKRPFLLLHESGQIDLVKKILAPLWVAEIEDNCGTFLRPSAETFPLSKEQRDLLFISYVVCRYERLHFSTLLGVFEKHHMDTEVLLETDVYFLPRSPFFSIDHHQCITLENFPPAKWMIEHLASSGSSINSDLPLFSLDQFRISQAVDENLPVCSSLALESVAIKKEAIRKKVISKSFKCRTKENDTENAKECPQDVLKLLGQRMYDGVACLMKYFELHIYSEFLENVLHVAKLSSLFLELSPSQQEGVIKARLCNFRIDEHGRMTFTLTRYSSRQLTKAVRMALCMSFMISQRGPMHYRELFKYYHKCVGRTKILHDSNQKQYFHSKSDIFLVCDSGFVSIVNLPVIQLDYVSILMSSGLCNPSKFDTHIERTGVKNSVNHTITQNNSCDVSKGSKMDIVLVEDNHSLPRLVECNTKLKESKSVESIVGTFLNSAKPYLTSNRTYDLREIMPENAASTLVKLEDNPMIQESEVLPKLDKCNTKLHECSVSPGILEANQAVLTDLDNFTEDTCDLEYDSFTHLDYFIPIAFSNKKVTENNNSSQINSSLVYETFPELQSTQLSSSISENFKQEPLCSNIIDSFLDTPYVDLNTSGSSETCDKTVVKRPNIPLKFNLLELQRDEPFFDYNKPSKSNIDKNISKCDCSKDLTKECRAMNFFIIILGQSKIGFSIPVLKKKLLLASKEVQHYISCVYKGSILNFLQNHDTFYISSTSANVCLKR